MNRHRVAAILRELAECIEEDAEEETKPRRPRSIVRPPGEAPAPVAGQAAKILRERGFR
jgi:hypothetical protein